MCNEYLLKTDLKRGLGFCFRYATIEVGPSLNIRCQHRRRLRGQPGHVPPPVIEKRLCIYYFFYHLSPHYFGLPTQYLWQVYASVCILPKHPTPANKNKALV